MTDKKSPANVMTILCGLIHTYVVGQPCFGVVTKFGTNAIEVDDRVRPCSIVKDEKNTVLMLFSDPSYGTRKWGRQI